MKAIDIAKALGVAVASLGLNLLLVTGVITIYAKLVAPGHPESFYNDAAPGIASWWAPAGGAMMLFLFTAWLGGRGPGRNAYAFAGACWALYAIVDVGSGWAMGGIRDLLSVQVALSMLTALAGAAAGAALSQAGPTRQGTPS